MSFFTWNVNFIKITERYGKRGNGIKIVGKKFRLTMKRDIKHLWMYKHVHTALMAEGFWRTDTVTCNSVSSTLTLINVDVRNVVCVSVDDSLQSPVWLKLQLIKLNYWKKMEDGIARLIECWRPGGWEEEGNHSHSFIDIIYKKSVISS